LEFKGKEELEQEKAVYFNKFKDLISQVKGKADYDCTLSYSGGKDSSYTLYLLREVFGLQVLAGLSFMFAFAASSLTFRVVPTIFIGGVVMFFLVVGGSFFHLDLAQYTDELPGWFEWGQKLFSVLPPLRDYPINLKAAPCV